MQRPDERFTPPEFERDPQLDAAHKRASGIHIILAALGSVVILGLMIYGLNQPQPENIIASAPPAQTTGAATPAEAPAPQSGGNVAGGENAAPAKDAAPQNQPTQQPAPQQTKPGVVEDDSKR
ncbi:hypothetical protein [Pseudorhodoplanes sp.]|uniref:hypothetical protein n=1 Tax=Pseudorhodoplanes sp. TaxID=1934341 RepID=UPI002CC8B254|nr:hypothetical protein [Pseudorhodoplanes sp.]HWV52064.1 hypothetical protein [Pseudorhodoplanes sp.]